MRTFRGQVDREVVVDLGLGEDNLTGTLDRRVAHVSSQNVHDIHRGLGKALGAVHQLDGRIRLVLIEHTNSGSDEGSGQSDNLALDLGVTLINADLDHAADVLVLAHGVHGSGGRSGHVLQRSGLGALVVRHGEDSKVGTLDLLGAIGHLYLRSELCAHQVQVQQRQLTRKVHP